MHDDGCTSFNGEVGQDPGVQDENDVWIQRVGGLGDRLTGGRDGTVATAANNASGEPSCTAARNDRDAAAMSWS
jgi:hypothetical protein